MIAGLVEWVRENTRIVVGVGLLYVGAAHTGRITPVWEIPGFGIVVMAGVVVAIAGYIAGGAIDGLLPEDEGIYVVAFESSEETGGEIYELSEDQFNAMDVHAGTLFEWPTAKRVYEVKEYRPEENVAVANWRESVAGSQLAGDALVVDAMDQIAELRDEFEPEARKSRRLQRRIRSIVRRLDRRRMMDQQEILDPTTTPSFGDDDATVSAVVEEELPEDLKPESMKAGDGPAAETNGHGETIGFELLDEAEALSMEDAN
ncbi:hypothetical protein [Halorubrum sp. 48-1-W]|uniref:hypothetical protein n=1 Tax=Halorubrum sp. 48-1-W TaxID=2249761 RepID=UPI001F545A90|nr:hypothetical protein [Halorubrum sp. 48-1-W]